MSDHSTIEWTDSTWNVITGCSIKSRGCRGCYAMKLAGTRLRHHPSRAGLTVPSATGPVWTGEVRFNERWLNQPQRWKRPREVFVCAHGDLFHEAVPDDWIDQVFAVMAECPWHTFQVLTKRSARMRAYMTAPGVRERIEGVALRLQAEQKLRLLDDDPAWPLPNVIIMVSAERQQEADERIPDLLATPAARRGVSLEPLVGPIDLQRACLRSCRNCGTCYPGGGRRWVVDSAEGGLHVECICSRLNGLHWVIVGGESGDRAEPMHPDWVRSLRDECAAADVPFHFKQWGEWASVSESAVHPESVRLPGNLCLVQTPGEPDYYSAISTGAGRVRYRIERIGKKAAGRLIDGVTHDGVPR